jgi:hypothetical protein
MTAPTMTIIDRPIARITPVLMKASFMVHDPRQEGA